MRAGYISILVLFLSSCDCQGRSFSIDYQSDSFSLDGKPLRLVSGSLHYARIPPLLWRDRLRKARAGGLNTVQFYVEWNLHERVPGLFSFTDRLDIERYIKVCIEAWASSRSEALLRSLLCYKQVLRD